MSPNTIGFDLAVRNGMSVAQICRDLKGQGVCPTSSRAMPVGARLCSSKMCSPIRRSYPILSSIITSPMSISDLIQSSPGSQRTHSDFARETLSVC